mmetsp:Transcript_146865/g.258853  ORF Transcript_146865/g.258853 Transcript_146865/m.258853 type:complete len:367 (-) Transcript_146865:28-1128(-)
MAPVTARTFMQEMPRLAGSASEMLRSDNVPGQRHSKRDAAVEDEVFGTGYFADVVFKCCGSSGEVEDIYGQSALFALLSPVLRERLYPTGTSEAPLAPAVAATGDELKSHRQEVWLDNHITASAFHEVTRYVYRLPHRLGLEKLPEVLAAARSLGLAELEEAALSWGLANLTTAAADQGEQRDTVGDALRCLAQLSEVEEFRTLGGAALIWRDALLQAHPASEVLSSSSFVSLPPSALEILLASEDVHRDPGLLWRVCVLWARQRPVEELGPFETARTSAVVKDGTMPRKLFIPGARLHTVSMASPSESEVEWQRWLLPIAEISRFSAMDACSFATHVEAIKPMLPELAQAIYAARRRGLRAGDTT